MKATVPAVQPLPAGLVTLADHETHARSRLDDNAWAYFSGGAGDEITLRANRQAWDELRLLPRVLQNLSGFTTQVDLLGRMLAQYYFPEEGEDIRRLVEQKGIDLTLGALAPRLERGELRAVILGQGEERYVAALRELAARFRDRFHYFDAQDEDLARLVFADALALLDDPPVPAALAGPPCFLQAGAGTIHPHRWRNARQPGPAHPGRH